MKLVALGTDSTSVRVYPPRHRRALRRARAQPEPGPAVLANHRAETQGARLVGDELIDHTRLWHELRSGRSAARSAAENRLRHLDRFWMLTQPVAPVARPSESEHKAGAQPQRAGRG